MDDITDLPYDMSISKFQFISIKVLCKVILLFIFTAPFLDMVTVPILAEWSDSCTSKLGRRRPFIIFLSTLLLISLVIVPYGPVISSLFVNSIKLK